MHDQVGIAADRRGEMGVAVQVQPEVADIVGAVDGLHLGAQHHLVDDLGVWRVAHLLQQPVEALGARRLAHAPAHVEGGEKVGEVLQLLLAGRLVHPVDQRRAALLQRLGGRRVGLDHHFLDQLVGVEELARGDRGDAAVRADDDAPLGTFDLQRRSLVPPDLERPVGGPEGAQDGLEQRTGHIVRQPIDGRLGLFVGEFGGGAHQAAHEAVRQLAALGVEHHAHGDAGAVLAFAQRTEAVG